MQGGCRHAFYPRQTCQKHLRLCGEYTYLLIDVGDAPGSSPPMRGAPPVITNYSRHLRITPAYAGSTLSFSPPVLSKRSSPHTRGAHVRKLARSFFQRVIPAYARNTPRIHPKPPCTTGHPQLCREHLPVISQLASRLESSPHMWRTPRSSAITLYDIGIIPTYVGNATNENTKCLMFKNHPHLCEEHCNSAIH